LRKARIAPGKALDIGAADGAFLRELRAHGFTDVVGVEPSAAPVRAAADDVRPYIRQELFDGDLFPPGTFGLVSCFQTIEHVYEPRALLEAIHRVLAPGGTAFLIAHDVEALSARLLGSKSPIFDIEHMQLFNRRSLRFLLERTGFTGVRVFPIWNAYPLSYWVKLFPLPMPLKLRALAALERGPLRALGNRLVAVPAGNLGVFGTKK
jgi:SAM-dependent methyltransferase